MESATEKTYRERLNRYVAAMNNEQPDRVPVRLFAQEFAAKYAGYSNFDVVCDYDLAFEATRKCAAELGCDATMSNAIVNWFGMSKAIGWKGVSYPGIELPLKSAAQWTEPEDEEDAFLKADEYDAFIDDPTGFLMNAWFPRFTEHIQPAGSPVTFEHNMSLVNGALAFSEYMGAFGRYAGLLRSQAGIVSANAGTLKAPLDIIGDKLRGYINLSMDLYERRDKVIAACEALMPHLLASALAGADPERKVPVTIWMHRGCVPFISPKDFEEIYWATLKPVVEEIWAHGHQVLFYAEGNWDRHLESFAQLPDRSIIFHVDKGDIFKAGRVLGRKFCLSGGVDNALLSYGTPEEVRDCCKKIIDGVAQESAYIMDASALIMDDAKVENVRAMIDYTLEHGVYSCSTAAPKAAEPEARVGAGKNSALFRAQKRRPGVCIPWEEKLAQLPKLTGNPDTLRKTWERVDEPGYRFIWTNLTW